MRTASRGYVVEYTMRDDPNRRPHWETVEDAVTPLQAITAVRESEGEHNVASVKTYPVI